MTVAKRLGLAGVMLVAVGACGIFFFARMLLSESSMQDGRINILVLGMIATLSAVVMMVFYRDRHRAVQRVANQLMQMSKTGQIGLVMTDANDMGPITAPLNELLTETKLQLDRLRAENRELQIQSRITSAEKHQTEAIIFSISDAVIVTNRFDELILANDAAEKLLDFKLETSQRKNIDRVITDGTLVRLIRDTRNHAHNAHRKVIEHCIDYHGVLRTFTITLSCVLTTNHEVSGVVAVLHDVTREKEISQVKTDFVSNVSHELKTPLASIKAYVEMLIDGEVEAESSKQEFYEIIASEADRLHRLIENILNISRIESGVVKVVREPISLTAVAKQVMDVAAPQAKLKNITMKECLAPVYYQVEADHDMIYQAILNLVSNAIKYTPDNGEVTVSVSVDERRGMAVCEISDNGLGIPADDLPHIFDKFYRVQANKKLANGTGMGLTLTKHIIETVHEGKLSVTSEQSKGSCFSFELPILV